MVCWMTERPTLRPGAKLRDQAHDPRGAGPWSRTCTTGSTSTRCTATRTATELALNEIGRVTLRTTAPLFFDEYRRNRTTGSFILIDEATNDTVGAGHDPRRHASERDRWRRTSSGTQRRGRRATTRPVGAGATVWFTGLSGSGKSTVAVAVERRLVADGRPAYLLDGDNLRHGLNGDLGFSAADRTRERPPRRRGRPAVRRRRRGRAGAGDQPVPRRTGRGPVPSTTRPACRSSRCSSTRRSRCASARDPKGLYAKARAGEITGFTGIDDPYEPPESAGARV